ncbi:methylated-DNA--[protein]-cysteine S-methyltransferase [Methylomonas sp. UP202]|uniref:methylated-DNA--[protein]-cysteine S-methyltransferase n=1 Tax=Methylomonas sp. UP202 TaxID=3040943 RepID=UPI00247B0A46|nr:methylated-DNA--[protein]-cysteine S-methyltransferase [Methylomonas sp. UP202]WGS87117.1 methylated-DNA--[protein]-cysteine S-methyltransferase [Methylomonas sp. UP202]
MTLHIRWEAVAEGETCVIAVPFCEANLIVTMTGDVVVDASWRTESVREAVSSLAKPFVAFLTEPEFGELNVTMLARGSAHRNRVWRALLDIPPGKTKTYAELAAELGSGPRAVAGACRDNPYAGLIPCHRVVAKSGLGGFMGETSGDYLALKSRLLNYEASRMQK